MNTHAYDTAQSSEDELSESMYNLLIGSVLCWGFVLNYLMVTGIDPNAISSVSPLLFFAGYFGLAFGGIAICNTSDNPLISFIGYNMIVVPFGFIINLAVNAANPTIVAEAIKTTGMVTIAMMCLGSLFPAFFRKIAGALFISLILVILAELVNLFFFKADRGFLDWAIVAIFCGYIGVDWGRANSLAKTADNAVDSAAHIYIDIVNLFLALLRILSRR